MKKKVLYIHHSGAMGGAPRSLAFLINELDKSIYEPIVWMMRDGVARDLFIEAGAEVIFNKSKFLQPFHGTTVSGMNFVLFLKNIIGYFPTYFEGKKVIKKIKPDIIHLSTTCLFQFAKAAFKINKKIKVISHVREPLLPNFFGKILLKQNQKYVDQFVAISKNDAKPFLSTKDNVAVIYNFVNINKYNFNELTRNSYRSKLNISNDNILLISYFARVSEENGVSNILKIAKDLEEYNDIKFAIFGFKNETNYEKEIGENITDNVFLIPMVNDVKEYLCASDVLLSPFIEPHFARAIVEASAIGIPSIVSNVDSQNELIKNNNTGILYNTIDEAKEAILFFYKDRHIMKKYGNNARLFAEEVFSAKLNSQRTTSLYD
ncbi:glycosyltransferase [Polaribacter sp. Q13]|uniref:glycosyltransferase n=1 Tax=Polaribacter sp. Q13 TaxID=2806551 RepID=UPI00193B9012|nr:glycosyltransferase [Polaribacter sp. Q13]QVY67329.1 glycosyltransferase [Polaribacter sp. Q13]